VTFSDGTFGAYVVEELLGTEAAPRNSSGRVKTYRHREGTTLAKKAGVYKGLKPWLTA
jgi:hypothetical protein